MGVSLDYNPTSVALSSSGNSFKLELWHKISSIFDNPSSTSHLPTLISHDVAFALFFRYFVRASLTILINLSLSFTITLIFVTAPFPLRPRLRKQMPTMIITYNSQEGSDGGSNGGGGGCGEEGMRDSEYGICTFNLNFGKN